MLLSIPTIDLTPYREGGPAGKHEVAQRVGEACRDIGFLVVSGHGVPDDLVSRTQANARAFFSLPAAEKKRYRRPGDDVMRGFSGICEEVVAYTIDELAPPDLKESLDIGPLDITSDDYFHAIAAGTYFTPNIWPARPPELRQTWTAYYREMERLSADLMRIFALALDLPETYFDRLCDRHVSVLRVLHYPNQAESPAEGQLRAGAHSDFGSLTILRQEDRPGGLQVRNAEGDWIDVPAVPNTFVINLGDMMARWTNDRWVSTMHRVVNPPRAQANDSDRVSLVFFQQPNYDAEIACIESCHSPDRPARYAPVTSGEYLMSKFIKQTTATGGGAQA